MLGEPLTIRHLQAYIKKTDYHLDKKEQYFYKLVEELGELSEVIRKDKRLRSNEDQTIKGTIEEELVDVLYYVVAIANVYDIDLEQCFELKEELNKVKWNKS
jgi:NTP pyrophosphatase (non-canonical NTP hydrolase)